MSSFPPHRRVFAAAKPVSASQKLENSPYMCLDTLFDHRFTRFGDFLEKESEEEEFICFTTSQAGNETSVSFPGMSDCGA